MMKSLSLAGFFLLALSLAGCGKVEKCKRGEQGCLGGAPDELGSCAAGLISDGTSCIEPGDLPGYCDDAEHVPATVPTLQSCKPRSDETLDFAEVCRRRCVQRCRRAESICEDFTCDQDCRSQGVMEACDDECGDEEDPVACLTNSCLRLQAARCQAFDCPADHPRQCGDVQCSDSCTDNTNDGYCDDGDPASALYSLCAYGTDCSDCGPRRGSRPARSPLQGLCPAGRDLACEGYNDDYTRNNAFCVHIEGTQDGQFSCVPDCTNDDEECPDGFECQGLVYANRDPYVDLKNVQGFACFPTFCGN